MANPTLCSFLFFILSFISSSSSAQAAQNIFNDLNNSSEKNNCYNHIDSGLWGEQCRASKIERENCTLRCLSPICYELIYQYDPLEEGERDTIRSQEYGYCMRRVREHSNRYVVHSSGGLYSILKGYLPERLPATMQKTREFDT